MVVEAAAAKCAACHRPGVIDPTSAAPRRQAGRQAEGKTGKVAAVESGRGGAGCAAGGMEGGRECRGLVRARVHDTVSLARGGGCGGTCYSYLAHAVFTSLVRARLVFIGMLNPSGWLAHDWSGTGWVGWGGRPTLSVPTHYPAMVWSREWWCWWPHAASGTSLIRFTGI